jgi:MFS superfamily sulfate permease-like transporter
VIVSIRFLTPYLGYLPMCVLAATVTASTRSLLQFNEMIYFWKGKKTDFAQMIVTIICLVALDVQNGLFAGIGFSFLLVLYRAFQPRLAEVARLPGTQCWVACDRFPEARREPGITVFRLDGEICFGNVHSVEERLLSVINARESESNDGGSEAPHAAADAPVASAAPSAASTTAGASSAKSAAYSAVTLMHQGPPSPVLGPPSKSREVHFRSVFALSGEEEEVRPQPAQSRGLRRRGGLGSQTPGGSEPSLRVDSSTADADATAAARSLPPPHVVIFDCSRVVDVDASGAKSLNDVTSTLRARGIPLLLAALPGPVRDTLERYGVDANDTRESEPAALAQIEQTPHSANDHIPALSLTVPSRAQAAAELRFTRYLTVSAAQAAAMVFLESE